MSIHDFHQKFVSATENNALVQSLRRLSLLDDPKVMFSDGTNNEWVIWTEPGASLSQA